MVSEKEWTDYIRDDSHCPHLRNRPPSDVSIFRVPKFLKDTNREAYVPRRVSLGPYHYGSAELPSMGHHKGRALRRMMKRFNANKNLRVDPNHMDFANPAMEEVVEVEVVEVENQIRDSYEEDIDPNHMDFANRAMEEIVKVENQIRNSYEEEIDYNREELARMLCLDGCFLIEVLRSLSWDELSIEEARKCYDPICGERKLSYAAQDVRDDLLVLENQIPFIVLLKLLQLELNTAVAQLDLFYLAQRISSCLIPFDTTNLDIDEQWSCHHHHLLDFLHSVITSPTSNEGDRVDEGKCCISIHGCSNKCIRMLQGKSRAPNYAERIPHAVELRNAGIKFSALQRGCIKQIKFDENSATIFLPPISIMDRTEGVLRNLIAYEMCKPSQINYVSFYVGLMDDLIDTEQDVALMRRMSVIKNWLGSDKEVADLFNGLGEKVTLSRKDDFHNLTEKVNAHYNNKIKVQIGKLVQDHFSSPWNALALTAAIVILLLTVLQTIFTIISVYKK